MTFGMWHNAGVCTTEVMGSIVPGGPEDQQQNEVRRAFAQQQFPADQGILVNLLPNILPMHYSVAEADMSNFSGRLMRVGRGEN